MQFGAPPRVIQTPQVPQKITRKGLAPLLRTN